MTEYVIRFFALAGHATHGSDLVKPGWYLASYDPEAFDGLGDVAWTSHKEKAHKYANKEEAFKHYQAVPKRRPRRPDGHPNKPLTAFTVIIEPYYNE